MDHSLAQALGDIPAGHGPVGLLSGDEFTPAVEPFDRLLLEACGPRIAIVVAAAGVDAPNAGRHGLSHYRRLGADPVVVDCVTRDQATADVLPPYDVLFIAGGSPRALLRCLRESPLWDQVLRRWRKGAALAGASAGAMALCRHCLLPKPGGLVPTQWTDGLGPIEGCGVAVHADSRPRT